MQFFVQIGLKMEPGDCPLLNINAMRAISVKSFLKHSLTWCLVKWNQPYLDLLDNIVFAELDLGHIDKVNVEILCYYHHLFKFPTTPCPKSSIDCTE